MIFKETVKWLPWGHDGVPGSNCNHDISVWGRPVIYTGSSYAVRMEPRACACQARTPPPSCTSPTPLSLDTQECNNTFPKG